MPKHKARSTFDQRSRTRDQRGPLGTMRMSSPRMREIADQHTLMIAFELVAELLINGVNIQRGRKAAEAFENDASGASGKCQV